MKKYLTSHLRDFLLLVSLALVSVLFLIVMITTRSSKENLLATIYVRNDVVEKIDLSKEKEEERHIAIQGVKSEVTLAVKKNYIAVEENDCPGQVCVHDSPLTHAGVIVCAYQQIRISVGESYADVLI